jgi:citrate synthase
MSKEEGKVYPGLVGVIADESKISTVGLGTGLNYRGMSHWLTLRL